MSAVAHGSVLAHSLEALCCWWPCCPVTKDWCALGNVSSWQQRLGVLWLLFTSASLDPRGAGQAWAEGDSRGRLRSRSSTGMGVERGRWEQGYWFWVWSSGGCFEEAAQRCS